MLDERGELSARLARVASKVAAAASLPGGPVMFGADVHRFRIGPALSEDAVAVFEKHHGVRLPPDYRGFITTVGHGGLGRFGGAGPFYGLLQIEDWALLSPASR
ncbi:SMI1/KNR4 family protein [Micromonospora echinofusca]|uniref:Knr4/Smi1-like domain-containing protein n=1 Tax=Micromonospora echinofusca TaxID=47858 RepID=A0ABS3VYR7_MICEH|nr:SMI1/KNR4 family protein [Micromonospora echinofusca]MBO4209578.1 hypothetical protein [Micromonospora echinofusca]